MSGEDHLRPSCLLQPRSNNAFGGPSCASTFCTHTTTKGTSGLAGVPLPQLMPRCSLNMTGPLEIHHSQEHDLNLLGTLMVQLQPPQVLAVLSWSVSHRCGNPHTDVRSPKDSILPRIWRLATHSRMLSRLWIRTSSKPSSRLRDDHSGEG
jgi:hypothetical protein